MLFQSKRVWILFYCTILCGGFTVDQAQLELLRNVAGDDGIELLKKYGSHIPPTRVCYALVMEGQKLALQLVALAIN